MSSRKFFSLQNGSSSSSSSSTTVQQNGHATYGFFCEPKVVAPEMAFFCFDVLHKELHGLDRHVEPHHIGIANSSL
jgi:hypothetical protein